MFILFFNYVEPEEGTVNKETVTLSLGFHLPEVNSIASSADK